MALQTFQVGVPVSIVTRTFLMESYMVGRGKEKVNGPPVRVPRIAAFKILGIGFHMLVFEEQLITGSDLLIMYLL